MSLLEFEMPIPPRKEDQLFRDDLPDWRTTARVNTSSWADPKNGYMEGYRRAAHVLVDHVADRGHDRDVLVYPIIFLYRHHIELTLKSIILQLPYLLDKPLIETEKRLAMQSHKLDELWQLLKPKLEAVCETVGWDKLQKTDIEGIDCYIRQLTTYDPNSFSFRYAYSTKGDPSLPDKLRGINLRHFAEMMERLANFLDSWDTALGEVIENKSEMEADMRAEWADYSDYGDYL